MKRIIATLLFFIAISLGFNAKAGSDGPPCTNTGSSTTDRIDLSGGNCMTTPDVYKIAIYEVGLCNNIDPTNPTTLPATDSSCTKLFYSPTPVYTEITNSLDGANLSGGTITMPSVGSYNFAYIKIANTISTKLTKYLSNPSPAYGDNNGSGSICWTIDSSYQNHTDHVTVDCGSNPAPDFVNRIMTNFECGNGPYYCNTGTQSGGATTYQVMFYVTNNGTLPTYSGTWDSGHMDVNTLSATNQIYAFFALDTPINVTANTSTANILFLVSNSVKIKERYGTSIIEIKNAPFGIKFSVN